MPTQHRVRSGECIASIADAYGFLWEALWLHPANAELRQRRETPEVLAPGDIVEIPDLCTHVESIATAATHKFVRKGVPALMRLRVLKDPEPTRIEQDRFDPTQQITEDPEVDETLERKPEAKAPYSLTINSLTTEGKTDSDGLLEMMIPPGAQRGRLVMYPGTEQQREIELELGVLDPADTIKGVAQRLANLGIGCDSVANEETPELAAAIAIFQTEQGLDVTGEADAETRAVLKDAHQS